MIACIQHTFIYSTNCSVSGIEIGAPTFLDGKTAHLCPDTAHHLKRHNLSIWPEPHCVEREMGRKTTRMLEAGCIPQPVSCRQVGSESQLHSRSDSLRFHGL